jgi:hypothetical protein
MPQRVRGSRLGEAGIANGLADRALERLIGHVVTADRALSGSTDSAVSRFVKIGREATE